MIDPKCQEVTVKREKSNVSIFKFLPVGSDRRGNCYGNSEDPGCEEEYRWLDPFLYVSVGYGGGDSDNTIHSN